LQEENAQFLSILDRWQSAVDYLAGGISELRPLTKRVVSFTDSGKAFKRELKARAPSLAAGMERYGIDSKPLHSFVEDWGSDTEVRALLSRLSAKALASPRAAFVADLERVPPAKKLLQNLTLTASGSDAQAY